MLEGEAGVNTLCLLGLPLGGRTLGTGIIDYQATIKRTFDGRITVLIFSGDRYENIAQMIRENYSPAAWNIVLGGYSEGASDVGNIAANIENRVTFLFALQPSLYYAARNEPLGKNVTEAYCCYNPWWFETMGLGADRLKLAVGNAATKLVTDQKHDSHGGVQFDADCKSKVIAGIGRALAA